MVLVMTVFGRADVVKVPGDFTATFLPAIATAIAIGKAIVIVLMLLAKIDLIDKGHWIQDLTCSTDRTVRVQ